MRQRTQGQDLPESLTRVCQEINEFIGGRAQVAYASRRGHRDWMEQESGGARKRHAGSFPLSEIRPRRGGEGLMMLVLKAPGQGFGSGAREQDLLAFHAARSASELFFFLGVDLDLFRFFHLFAQVAHEQTKKL